MEGTQLPIRVVDTCEMIVQSPHLLVGAQREVSCELERLIRVHCTDARQPDGRSGAGQRHAARTRTINVYRFTHRDHLIFTEPHTHPIREIPTTSSILAS